MASRWNGPNLPRVLLVSLVLAAAAGLAAADGEKSTLDSARLFELLESREISQGGSDAQLRDPASGMQVQTHGDYAVFTMSGLDATDRISLISKDGAFIYANYASCSESQTFFRSRAEYLRYLLAVR